MVLSIPKLNLKTAVVQGVTSRDLSMGPGLYPDSALPGDKGNVAIAGHRNVFGSWFRYLNRLEPGDRISISYQGRDYEYSVEKVYIVAENDWSVVAPTNYRALTLTTCDPPGNVTQRLIVRARQTE
ncbi:MAG: class E sortase [Syntrophomonadaceae bacterium]